MRVALCPQASDTAPLSLVLCASLALYRVPAPPNVAVAATLLDDRCLAPLPLPFTQRLLITLRDRGVKTLLIAKGQEGNQLKVDGIEMVEVTCVLHAFLVAKSLSARLDQRAATSSVEDPPSEDGSAPSQDKDDSTGAEKVAGATGSDEGAAGQQENGTAAETTPEANTPEKGAHADSVEKAPLKQPGEGAGGPDTEEPGMAAQLKEGSEKKGAEEESTGQEEAPRTPTTHSPSSPPGGAPEGSSMAVVSVDALLCLGGRGGRKQVTPTSSVSTKATPTFAPPKISAGGPSGVDSGVIEEKGQKGLGAAFESENQEAAAAKMMEEMEEGQKGPHSDFKARAKADEKRASEDAEGEEQEGAECEDGHGKAREKKKAGRQSPAKLSSKPAVATPEAKGKVKGKAKTPPSTPGTASHPSFVLHYTITSGIHADTSGNHFIILLRPNSSSVSSGRVSTRGSAKATHAGKTSSMQDMYDKLAEMEENPLCFHIAKLKNCDPVSSGLVYETLPLYQVI